MNLSRTLFPALAIGALAGSASATVVVFNQKASWDAFCTMKGNVLFSENFSGFTDGVYNPLVGITEYAPGGPSVTWEAASSGGVSVDAGVVSSTSPRASIAWSFLPSGEYPVYGIGGNFFATDADGNPMSSLVLISLANGVTYASVINSSSAFTGFYSLTDAITSITLAVSATSSTTVFTSTDNLYFATVPAPGVFALLGAAGLVANRRRR
jgi:hypothetical protein